MRRSITRWLPLVGGAVLLAAVAATAPSIASRPVRADGSGPVAEWTFDEGSGTTTHDAVGTLDGTLSGGVSRITEGVPQGTGALSFDGTDGKVVIPNDAILEPASTFSLAAWVRSGASGATTIIGKGGGGCWFSSYGLAINVGLFGEYLSDGYGAWVGVYPSSLGSSPLDGKWHHVVLIVEPSMHMAYIYVDGRPSGGSSSGLEAGIRYNGDPLTVRDLVFGGPAESGCGGAPGYFDGAIDDVRLYDRALDLSEIDAFLTPFATTTTVSVDPTTMLHGATATYTATVTPVPPTGSVVFLASLDGAPEQWVGRGEVDGLGHVSSIDFNGQGLSVGHYALRAVFSGGGPAQDSQSSTIPFQVDPIPTRVTIRTEANPWIPDTSIQLDVTLGWADPALSYGPGGQVTIFDVADGTETPVATATPGYVYGSGPYWASATVPGRHVGAYTYRVRYAGAAYYGASSADVTLDVAKGGTSTALTATPGPIQQHHPLELDASTSFPPLGGPGVTGTGTLAIRDLGTGTIVASGDPGATLVYTTSDLVLGDHQFRAEYGGDDRYAASQSDPITVTIAADVVDATGVTLQYATFYPYKDGYRDTVAARGTRQEAASVSIRIYSPRSKLLKTIEVPSGIGAYTATWSGRNGAGTILPAGKYRVVQVLTDGAGTHRTVTSYVTLSTKRLYYSTVTYTKSAKTQYAKKGTGWLAWSFKVPSAVVFKTLVFSVYGKSDFGYGGFGPHDFTACGSSAWSTSCATRRHDLPLNYAWLSVKGSATKDHSGSTLRLYVWSTYGTSYAVSGRVRATYGVLR
jgi:hypothetical protein